MDKDCHNKLLTPNESRQVSLQVLVKFDQICKENGFKYFLMYGTLIGAIRHNGFIPWDDDIDVIMPRKDFDRFIEYTERNKDELYPLKLHTRKNTLNYFYGIPRLSDMTYKYIDESSVNEKFDIGAFIDIYPLDNYCSNKHDGYLVWAKCKKMNEKYSHYVIKTAISDRFIKKYLRLLYYFFLRAIKGKNYNQIIEETIHEYVLSKTSDNDLYCGVAIWDSFRQYEKKELRDFKTEKHVFEGYQFNIPIAYDYILRKVYGDYMQIPSESERHPTHYYRLEKR